MYCHVFQWLRRGFGSVNRFIGSSLVVTTIISYTLKFTVTTAHVTSHTKSSDSSSRHAAVHLELRNSSEVNSHSRILSYPLGTDHAQKTQFYCCVAQTTQETSHVRTISPVHWLADSCLATRYKHASYCCLTLGEKVFIAPLPSYRRYTIIACLYHALPVANNSVSVYTSSLTSSTNLWKFSSLNEISQVHPFLRMSQYILWRLLGNNLVAVNRALANHGLETSQCLATAM
jgi:hypothetical protein